MIVDLLPLKQTYAMTQLHLTTPMMKSFMSMMLLIEIHQYNMRTLTKVPTLQDLYLPLPKILYLVTIRMKVMSTKGYQHRVRGNPPHHNVTQGTR